MSDFTPQSEKLYKAMKRFGAISEEKAIKAEKCADLSTLPKAQCMNALQDLKKKGYIKEKKKDVSVLYYLIKSDV